MKPIFRITIFIFTCSMLMISSGCGLEGRWESRSFKPEIARDKFRLMGPTIDSLGFRRTTIIFEPDGRFHAETVYGNRIENTRGEWELYKGKLTLINEDGRPYTYDMKLKDWDSILKLTRRLEGTDIILTLKKIPYENGEIEGGKEQE